MVWLRLFVPTHRSAAVSEYELCTSLWRRSAPCGGPSWLQRTSASGERAAGRPAGTISNRVIEPQMKRNSFKHQFSTQTVLSRDVVRCVKIENDFKWFIWFYRILFPQEEVINSEPTIFMHLDFYSKLSSSGGRPGSSESDGLLKLCSHPQESRSASLEKHTNQIWKQAQEQFKTSTQTH